LNDWNQGKFAKNGEEIKKCKYSEKRKKELEETIQTKDQINKVER
jgi:hypothetical protein